METAEYINLACYAGTSAFLMYMCKPRIASKKVNIVGKDGKHETVTEDVVTRRLQLLSITVDGKQVSFLDDKRFIGKCIQRVILPVVFGVLTVSTVAHLPEIVSAPINLISKASSLLTQSW
jgi:hypothetical protein